MNDKDFALEDDLNPSSVRHTTSLLYRLFFSWMLDVLSVLVVVHAVRGFEVLHLYKTIVASLVIGFTNLTIGLLVESVVQPISAFFVLMVMNIFLLKFAFNFVEGFYADNIVTAMVGAILIAFLNAILSFFLYAIIISYCV